jgi:Flp pilus assembly protein TadG
MRLCRSEDGSILIEFALILTPMILILASMVDYALWIQKEMQFQEAASASAAYGAVPGNLTVFPLSQGEKDVMTALAMYIVTGSSTKTNSAAFTVTPADFYACTPGGSHVAATTTCASGAPFHYVQVATSGTMNNLIPFRWIPSSLTLHGSATYRIEVYP